MSTVRKAGTSAWGSEEEQRHMEGRVGWVGGDFWEAVIFETKTSKDALTVSGPTGKRRARRTKC